MQETIKNIKIKKVGNLKYNKIKSISILKMELCNFFGDIKYSDTRDIIDYFLSGHYDKEITLNAKKTLDQVFENMEYEEIENRGIEFNENKYHIV